MVMMLELVLKATDMPEVILTWAFSPLVNPLNITVSTRWYGFGVSGIRFPTSVRSDPSTKRSLTPFGVCAIRDRAQSAAAKARTVLFILCGFRVSFTNIFN